MVRSHSRACKPLRVGLISSSLYKCPPDAYGSEVTTWDLAEVLGSMGHEVHLWAPPGSRCPPGGELHYIPSRGPGIDPAAEASPTRADADLLLDLDVVHDCSATCRVADWMWGFHRRTNVLVTRNGLDATFPIHQQNIICISHDQARRFATESRPVLVPSSMVVPYGVNISFYRPALKAERGYFLYLSRPHWHKGVSAFITIAEATPEERFVMAWHADAEDHKAAEREALEDAKDVPNLEFADLPVESHHEKKRELYRGAKALVIPLHPNYVEAFGLVFAEALACGTPVVTAAHGSCPEVVTDGVTGVLVEHSEKLGTDWPAALKLAAHLSRKACRRDAVARFGRELMAERLLELYRQVIKGRCW